MSPIIRTRCPACGEVDLDPGDVRLTVELPQDEPKEGVVTFRCPSCSDEVVKVVDRGAIAALVVAGVDVEQHRPLTLDDVLAFAEALEDEAAVEQFFRDEEER